LYLDLDKVCVIIILFFETINIGDISFSFEMTRDVNGEPRDSNM
jgi:hypothetical protein